MRLERLAWGVFLTALLAFAGCAGDNMAEVKGMVKFDGKLIEEGAITFLPDKGPATGTGIKAGKYSCRVPLGSARVMVSKPVTYEMKKLYPDDPKSPEVPMRRESLPPEFSHPTETKLTFEIKSGVNEKDFDLKSE
jgi:hypothetical protein